jgi:hypothetical protein
MEAIDSTEHSLRKAPDVDRSEYDPAYLDDLTERALDTMFKMISRLDENERQAFMAGKLTELEQFHLLPDELDEILRTYEELGAEAEAVLADEDVWRELATAYKKKGEKCDTNAKFCILPSLTAVLLGGPLTAAAGTLTLAYCYCAHCKGDTRDLLCGKERTQ